MSLPNSQQIAFLVVISFYPCMQYSRAFHTSVGKTLTDDTCLCLKVHPLNFSCGTISYYQDYIGWQQTLVFHENHHHNAPTRYKTHCRYCLPVRLVFGSPGFWFSFSKQPMSIQAAKSPCLQNRHGHNYRHVLSIHKKIWKSNQKEVFGLNSLDHNLKEYMIFSWWNERN